LQGYNAVVTKGRELGRGEETQGQGGREGKGKEGNAGGTEAQARREG